MDIEHINSFAKLFNNIYRGDKHATELSFDLLDYLHLWDDLIDKDKPVSDGTINTVMLSTLTTISESPLWGSDMSTLLRSVYLRWYAANNIESDKSSSDNDLAKAWMLRAGCYDLFVLLANKLYGQAWSEAASIAVYDFYGETLTDFIKETRDA